MPMVQGRLPIASDFEDISLYDAKDIKTWRAQRDSRSSQDSASSDSNSDDPHASIQSVSSTISTPTLASDTSSLRSSLCSISSPTLANTQFVPPQAMPNSTHPARHNSYQQHSHQPQAHLPPGQIDAKSAHNPAAAVVNPSKASMHQVIASDKAAFGRRRSVPALIDNTSMASLTIKAQAGSRSRKQREMEYEADQDDDIWPTDGLMFNVPMSPALYAQQRNMQHNHLPNSRFASQSQPHLAHMRPPASHHRKQPQVNVNNAIGYHKQPRGSPPSNQQFSASQRRSSAVSLRKSLPSIHEAHDGRQHESTQQQDDAEAPESYQEEEHVAPLRNIDMSSRKTSICSLPSLMSRRGSYASEPNSSIDGLDPDASDLTLELYKLEGTRQRPDSSYKKDTSHASIASLSMLEDGSALPSPSMRSSEDGGSDMDSRRSSLTRPNNLPPKSPEEEKKHLKEYEKLLREAAAAEKRKQQKREEERNARANQEKQDYATWSQWLAKGGKGKLSSDLKWRGVPEKLRGAVWKQLRCTPNSVSAKTLPPNPTFRYAIVRDSELMWPDCCIFGQGRPLHASLVHVVEQFMATRPEIKYSFSLTGIAALLLLHLSEAESISVMVNIIEPKSLIHAILSGNERLASATYVSFHKIFHKTFERLSEHFAKIHLTDAEVLDPMIGSLFTTVTSSPEAAARILDVFLFDGDAFLLRAALGVLRVNEAWLYASKEEIIHQLTNSRTVPDDELMKCIRNITKH